MDYSVVDVQQALGDRYVVERELGAGGMATVYLARDAKHERLVAIKVLRPELAAVVGGERFLKEIRTTANLQHPHILSLHDSGQADGVTWYVMPFVEGESLRDRLRREKQLPVAEAVRIACEVASGLDYAHRHGVVHRDIKPENILLHDGRALVADFGIALAMSRSDGASRITETGMSLGTPHYMSPEQAMGEREMSPGSDIYSLACVLYEMLAGEPPFTGPTAQAIVARVITDEPRTLTSQRRTVPAALDAAVQRALAKLPADRFATAAQFADAIGAAPERAPGPATAARPATPPQRRHAVTAAIALVALGLGAAGGMLLPRSTDGAGPPAVFTVAIPEGRQLLGGTNGGLTMSADGRSIIYSGASVRGGSELLHRRIDDGTTTTISGSDGATVPVLSPDGQWVAYFAGGQFRKLPVRGGSSVALANPGVLGIPVWSRTGRLITHGPAGTIGYLGDEGFETLVGPDSTDGESMLLPVGELPDGRVLALALIQGLVGKLWLFDLGARSRTLVLSTPAAVAAYSDGHLAWVTATGTLMAAAFDARTGQLSGDAHVIASDVSVPAGVSPQIAFAAVGSLVYAPALPADLVVTDRTGQSEVVSDRPRRFHSPRVSPDGSRLAFDVTGEQRDVWVQQRDDGTMTRATFANDGHDPIWLPDGRTLLYASARGSSVGVHRAAADGSGAGEPILFSGVQLTAHSVTPDGSEALVARLDTNGGFDVMRLSLAGKPALTPVLASPRFSEGWAVHSPDGRWVAYTSDESGRPEVYVRSVQGEGRATVSTGGGTEPVWSRDGSELFFRDVSAKGLHVARIETTPTLRVRARAHLFDASNFEEATPHANYDVTPDGKFVFVRQPRITELVFIQNWPEIVRRRTR